MQAATAAGTLRVRGPVIPEPLGHPTQVLIGLAGAKGINDPTEYELLLNTHQGLPVVASLQEAADVLAVRGHRAATDAPARHAQYLQPNGHPKEA